MKNKTERKQNRKPTWEKKISSLLVDFLWKYKMLVREETSAEFCCCYLLPRDAPNGSGDISASQVAELC